MKIGLTLAFLSIILVGLSSTARGDDSLFYCDATASLIGSTTCQLMSFIDGRFPVTTAVRPNGYPILFFAGTPELAHQTDKFVQMFWMNCLDYGCTEVSYPEKLKGFNGLFGVDTAIIEENGELVLAVAGVGDQLEEEDIENLLPFGGVYAIPDFAQYPVVTTVSLDSECSEFRHTVYPDLPPVFNSFVSPVLVLIDATGVPEAPIGLSLYTFYYVNALNRVDVEDYHVAPIDLQGPWFQRNAEKKAQRQNANADKKDETDASAEPELANEGSTSEKRYSFQQINQRWQAQLLLLISCVDARCSYFINVETVFLPISNSMGQFPADRPWTSQITGENQLSDYYGEENLYRTLPNSPFSFNTYIPRLIALRNAQGNLFVGIQSVQNMPVSQIRGLDGCRILEQENSESEEASELITEEAESPINQPPSVFGGTTSIRFLRDPFGDEEHEETYSADFSDSLPSSSGTQFSGRATIHSLSAGDANAAPNSDPGTRAQEDEESNIAEEAGGNWGETSVLTTCSLVERESLGPLVTEVRDTTQKTRDTRSTIGGSWATPLLASTQAGLSAPRSLVAGIAGNGLPAVLGIATSGTGEPSAAGWSLVLDVCITANCDQQVQRYLMDSSTLHDSWGIMDDPFASINQILNHPDGSWAIVLFVQPQGEQIDRSGILTVTGEGSSGKPFIINCLDDTCSHAYVSTFAPNRLQTSLPPEFYDSNGHPIIVNAPHSFEYVGQSAEYLLVTVRDLPLAHAPQNSANPAPPVRFWKTNRYASPTGVPCTPESVGSIETADSSLYICTRLNTGHDLTLGGISGWVRYYEWVDVGHSFASRLWANIPAGRSPLELVADEDIPPFPQLPALVLQPTQQITERYTLRNNVSSLEDQLLSCCEPGWHVAPTDAATFFFRTPVFPTEVRIYFGAITGDIAPLNTFAVFLIGADGQVQEMPIQLGLYSTHPDNWLPGNPEPFSFCTYVSIPVLNPPGRVSGVHIQFSGLFADPDCFSNQFCETYVGGVELWGSLASRPKSEVRNQAAFYPYPPELMKNTITGGFGPCQDVTDF